MQSNYTRVARACDDHFTVERDVESAVAISGVTERRLLRERLRGCVSGLLGALVLLLGAVGLTERAQAQGASEPRPNAERNSYLAALTGDRVRLRTGGSRKHHPFAYVGRGDSIVVVGEAGEWRKILVPRWIPLYVHARYVDRAGGREGVVSATRLVVRVVPDRRYESVGILERGSTVSVVGAKGDWLEIVPTSGTHAWIHGKYARRVRSLATGEIGAVWAQLSAARGAPEVPGFSPPNPREGAPAGVRDSGDIGPVRAVEVPAPRRSADRSVTGRSAAGLDAGSVERYRKKAISPRLAAIWTLLGESSKPGVRRDGTARSADYGEARLKFRQIIQTSDDRAEVRQAREGLDLIERLDARDRKISDARIVLVRAREKDQKLQQELKTKRTSRFRLEGVNNDKASSYLARGWVRAHGRFDFGRQGTHRLMKGNEVLYFLEAHKDSDIDLNAYLKQRVGIHGFIKGLESKHAADLIVVSEITVLSDR